MTGSCWRLLAVVSLIIVVVPAFLSSQDSAVDRIPVVQGPPIFGERSPNLQPIGVPPRNAVPRGTIVLPEITRAAGIIFSGHVTSMGRAPSAGRGYSATSVTFQVEHAMRGTTAGESLTIHEWSGLWARGEHYHVGERVLLFLYPPSKLGLTSPVAGIGGRFAVDPHGGVLIDPVLVSSGNRAGLSVDPLSTARTAIPYADFARAVLRTVGER